MLESLAEDLDAHRGAPDKDAGPPPGHPRGRRRAAHPLHHRHPGRHRRRPGRPAGRPAGHRRVARPPRPRAGGHRPELPAQARHGHAPGRRRARPRTCMWAIAAARLVLPARDPRAGAAQPLRRPGPAARRRHRRLGRRLAGHGRPRQPRAGLAGARHPARGHRGGRATRWRPASPSTRPSPSTPSAGSTRPCASRSSTRSDAEGLARDAPVVLGRRDAAARRCSTPARRRSAGRAPTPAGPVAEVLAGVALGQEVGDDEIVTLFSRPRPRGARGGRGGRRPAPRRRSATPSPSCTTATSTTPTSARSSAASAPSPRARSRSTCAAQPYLLELDEITRRVAEAEARGRHRGLPAGRHPSRTSTATTTSHVLEAVRAASERIHIHGFTALEVTEGARRSEVPLADYLIRLKDAGLKTLPGTAAEILDDEIRALICPDKINTEEWLEAHRTAHSVGLRSNITIMFGSVEQPVQLGPPHRAHPRPADARPAASPSSCRSPSCTWPRRSTCSARPGAGPTFRETLLMHAVARIAYHGDIDNIQVSWVKMGVEGVAPAAPGRGQRPRRHADGREHLAGRRRQPTASAWASRSSRPSWRPLGPPAGAALDALRHGGCRPPARVHRRAADRATAEATPARAHSRP